MKSFANKTTQEAGEKAEVEKNGIGYTCRKGLKPESPNQDSWLVMRTGQFSIFGVFDGHGSQGHCVSNFVKENLLKLVVSDPRFKTETLDVFKDAFEKMQTLIEVASSQ